MPSRKTSNNHDLLVQTALTVELLNTRRQTVSGSKAGNAALTSLMAALSALGLVLDTTS